MSPLEIIRRLAAQTKHVNPSALSRPQKLEYVDLSRKVYTPRFMEATRKADKWLELAQKTEDPVQRAKYLAAFKQAEYDAARFSKLDQAASSIGRVNRWDDEFRALTVPGHEPGVPGGIATYYPPGHSPEDAMLADSTYLELLGTSPDAKGAGRVLLRQTGLTSPSNPMTWHSTSYPETMGFYESRGAELVPKGQIPKDSAMYGNLPVFRVPRGDMLKEKKGGWIDFTSAPVREAMRMHVSPQDVRRGERLDAARRAELEALRTSPGYPSLENAERLPRSKAEQDDALFLNALLRGEEPSMSAPGRTVGDRVLEHSPAMRRVKEFYDKRTPGGKRAMWALGLLPAIAAPAALGVSLPTKIVTGALINAAMGIPFAALEPDVYDPARDVMYGAAFGASPVIGGAALGADILYQGAKGMAGGGLVKGLKMLFPNAAAPMHVVKPKGGNWLTGSVEGALRGLQARAGGAGGEILDTPLNNWIDGPLTKYVKTRMASPEDEVRRLADEGVLHFDADDGGILGATNANRKAAGSYGKELGNAPLGIAWEKRADAHVIPGTYRMLDQTPINFNLPDAADRQAEALRKLGGEYAVQNPDAIAYSFNDKIHDGALGFDHLVDELSNAMDPASGLPQHLMLSPEAVKNLSMEKAVRRVADINAWRAEQKVAASKELADKASVIREYTDPALPNPKGLRWVELKAKDGPASPVDAELVKDATGRMRDPRFVDLANQLKYEGDTMGHCVGRYCDDVTSGRSRIFSLRDAKGEPHVTVEVEPEDPWHVATRFKHDGDDDAKSKLVQALGGRNYTQVEGPELLQALKGIYGDAATPGARISQIKGKQNRKPNDEYLPFVQDFVKNSPLGSPWGSVEELHNAGLRRTIDAFNSNELKKIQAAGIEVPQWATPEEVKQIGAKVWPDLYPDVNGFAHGGLVNQNTTPADVVAQFLALELE